MSFHKLLIQYYKNYYDIIKKILISNNKKCGEFKFEEDYIFFNETYNINYYMDKNIDIYTYSTDKILDIMKNTYLINTTFCRNYASLKSIYNMAKDDNDKINLINEYKNFIFSLISFNKIISFHNIIKNEHEKIENEKLTIHDFLKSFNYTNPEEIAKLIDMIAYNSIIKQYFHNILLDFKIDLESELKDFNMSEQLLYLMYVEIPPVNINTTIFNHIRRFITKIFNQSKFIKNAVCLLENKKCENEKCETKKCNTCMIGKNKYEFKFSYKPPDDISNIKTTSIFLIQHVVHIASYIYETVTFYLQKENYNIIIDQVKHFKLNNYKSDHSNFFNKIQNYINKYSLHQFNMDNLINIFTIYYDDLYTILIDESSIDFIKKILIDDSFNFININNKEQYIDFIINNVLIYGLTLIKNNPNHVGVFIKYIKNIIRYINNPRLLKQTIKIKN